MSPDDALLRFVLQPGIDDDERIALWNRWADAGDIDDHSDAAYDLFPAVYRVLHDLGVDHRWSGRLKGVYRQAWTRNTLNRRTVSEAADVLDRAGIDHLDPRGSDDSDDGIPIIEPTPLLIVRWDDAGRARDALVDAGWRLGSTPQGGLGHLGVLQRYEQTLEAPESDASIRLLDHLLPGESGRLRSTLVWERAEQISGHRHRPTVADRRRAILTEHASTESWRWALELANNLPADAVPARITVPEPRFALGRLAHERLEVFVEVTGRGVEIETSPAEPPPPGMFALLREERRAARRLGLDRSVVWRHAPTFAGYGAARMRRRVGRLVRQAWSR